MPAPGLETFSGRIQRGHVWVVEDPIHAYMIAYTKSFGFLIDTVAVAPSH